MKELIINVKVKSNHEHDLLYAIDEAKRLIEQGYSSGDLSTDGVGGYFEIKEL